ncbi:unnamed protein product [Moneuplotes crassus]|uniref:Derlin n=1 Tax=Euplotes crassus TaxID=5936 RepID=A0AAD2D385_EUPCR|nr:unnamed protein product [Moneuplotes crassus]
MLFTFIFKLFGEVPPITRVLVLTTLAMSIGVKLELFDETDLFYDYKGIAKRNEYWRLFTPILCCGSFSMYSLFFTYLIYQYASGLEDSTFRTKSHDFFYLIFLIFASMGLLLYLTNESYVSPCFLEIIIYLWSKTNHGQIVHVLGFIRIRAGYLPIFFFCFSYLMEANLFSSIVGIIIGHVLFYLYFVVPELPFTRGWNIVAAPRFVKPCIQFLGLDMNREIIFEPDDFIADDDFAPREI